VPWSAEERAAFSQRVVVMGRSAAAVQAACRLAVARGVPVVHLPAGQYIFDNAVWVPGPLTLIGDGASTIVRAKDEGVWLFIADGHQVRLTRMALEGGNAAWNETNESVGIGLAGWQDLRLDHCSLRGFGLAVYARQAGTVQIDHCVIERNLRKGLSAVVVESGAYALVEDSQFGNNWHSVALPGDMHHAPGEPHHHAAASRPTHVEFRQNLVRGDELVRLEPSAAFHTHPDFRGTVDVVDNRFEKTTAAIDLRGGSGRVEGNVIIGARYGIRIEAGNPHHATGVVNVPHHISVQGNTLSGVPADTAYIILDSCQVSLNGAVQPQTNYQCGASPSMPELHGIGSDGTLRWDDSGVR